VIAIEVIEARDQRDQRDQSERIDQNGESGDDLGRLTTGLVGRVVSKRPTPTLRVATTAPGSARTVTPPADGMIGNGIAVIADAVTLMTDLDVVTCSTSDPDVEVARIDLTAVIVETGKSGKGVLRPRGARSLRQT